MPPGEPGKTMQFRQLVRRVAVFSTSQV